MKLSIKERIELPLILPEKSSFEKLIIKRDLLQKVDLSQQEIEEFKISSTDDGRITWFVPEGKSDIKEFDLTNLEKTFLRDLLRSLSEKEELPDSFVEVYKQLI